MAKTFSFGKKAEAPKDPGPKFKLLVRVCGLAVVGGIFLPFLLGSSILDISKGLPDAIEAVGFMGTVKGLFGGPTIPAALTKTLLLLGFVFVALLGLSMVLRARYRGGQMTFLILFNLGAWLMVNFFGAEAGIDGSFFVNTGPGYWVSCGALFVPFIGMFFLDKSV